MIHFRERKSQRGQLLSRFFGRRSLHFVNDLKEFVFVRMVGPPFGLGPFSLVKLVPRVSAAQADDKILLRQAERPERVNEQRDQFRVRRRIAFADEVGIELEMFAQTALLLFLVAEELRDGEPLDGLFVIAFVRGDHARERRRHFRA